MIRKKVEADFSGYNLDDADKIEEKGVVLYQVTLKGTSGKQKLLFTPDGLLKGDAPE